MRYVQSGDQQSWHTWVMATYTLNSWFDYLIAIDKDWRDVAEINWINSRDAYVSGISQKTVCIYDSASVHDNLTVVCDFHQFSATENSYRGDIGALDDRVSQPSMVRCALGYIRGRSRVIMKYPVLPRIHPGTKIYPLVTGQLRFLLN